MSEPNAPSRLRLALARAALAIAAVYGIGIGEGNAAGETCGPEVVAVAESLDPLATGDLAAFQLAEKAQSVRDLAFSAPDGSRVSIADWSGRTVLLNLWATWCAPCRHEMPALDALQKEFGGPDFEVVAINLDLGDSAKAMSFLDEINVKALAFYFEKSPKLFNGLRRRGLAFGMPTTLLIDTKGCLLGHLAGPAEWASEDAFALIKAAIAKPSG